jgi:hypothetical protein
VDYTFFGTFSAPFFTNEMQPRLPKQQHTSMQQAEEEEEEEDQPIFFAADNRQGIQSNFLQRNKCKDLNE